MSDSFDFQPGGYPEPQGKRKVLITGAAGNIGSHLAEYARDRYDLRLTEMEGVDTSDIEGFGEVVRADLLDLPSLRDACRGIDTVVHLAANPSPSTRWDEVMQTNIRGTYELFAAAGAEGCRRVVFASSIHAVSGYPAEHQVHADQPVSPGDIYGVSKAFGEAMGRYMATQHDLSVIAIRIGAFQPIQRVEKGGALGMMDAFVSHRDLAQLICRCVDDRQLRFGIFHGLSNNRFNRMDITQARDLLGYAPDDDFTEASPELRDLHLHENVTAHDEESGGKSGMRDDLPGA